MFVLKDGQQVVIPAGWSGAWMISDEAFSELTACCDMCLTGVIFPLIEYDHVMMEDEEMATYTDVLRLTGGSGGGE